MNACLPLTVITGFLGSGKTTIVREFLRRPGFQNTAVIINEFGAIGIDHDLIESSREDLMALSTGCLCCAMQGDLANTIRRLMAVVASGQVPGFDRILLETSGMADPTPILQTAIVDPYLSETVEIANVVVAVDALNGPAVIHDYDEARRQVALGDRVLITKSDLDAGAGAAAVHAVRTYRPEVAIGKSVNGNIDPELLFEPVGGRTAWLSALSEPHGHPHVHDAAVSTVSLRVEAPLHAVTLTLFLPALAENCGPDLLRVKGIVEIRESPGTPAVVHGVQHVFHPIDWLDQWPSEDRSSRLVLIGRRLDANWLHLLLQTIEEEVECATRL
jgi:G3E family GTPase